jgi:hypothetical protein
MLKLFRKKTKIKELQVGDKVMLLRYNELFRVLRDSNPGVDENVIISDTCKIMAAQKEYQDKVLTISKIIKKEKDNIFLEFEEWTTVRFSAPLVKRAIGVQLEFIFDE